MQIGYQGYSSDLSHPADRRRMGFWSKERNIPLLQDLSKTLDFMVFTSKSDMEFVVKYKGGYKVLDLIDGYITSDGAILDIGRGYAKNLFGQTSGTPRRYSSSVQRACRNVDLVICSSPEQAELVSVHNKNVIVILDSHHEFLNAIENENSNNCVEDAIFWEGQTATLHALNQISDSLIKVKDQKKFCLNLVTDENHKLLMNKYFTIRSGQRIPTLTRAFGESIKLHPWSKEAVIEIAKKSTLGIVPVDMRRNIQRLKPENRILILWLLGLPCLASDTPSHRRIANEINLDFICKNPDEWREKLFLYLTDAEVRKNQVLAGKRYLADFHSREIILSKWDAVFDLGCQ